MNLTQIQRLMSTVPPTIDDRQRARLTGYADTAVRCEARIRWLREEVENAMLASDGSASEIFDGAASEPSTALTLACELDALERLQPRVDAWLTDYVGALIVAHSSAAAYGDGAPT
jgi:hypothetical protein